MLSPKVIGNSNAVEGYDQTPISEWRVSDEEDSVPISQLLVADKEKVRGHRKDNSEWGKRMEKELGRIEKRQQVPAETIVTGIDEEAIEVEVNEDILTGSDEKSIPILFQKGHLNLGRACAKFFEAVLHHGNVTEVIPRRKGYFYKITYEDGDQEDMDEAELIFAIQLQHKKDKGDEVQDQTEVFSGVSEEGSEYDSEEARKKCTKIKGSLSSKIRNLPQGFIPPTVCI